NIVDDHTMEFTHVIRGEEWLPSAPLHVMMYRAFEWTAPEFAHLPLILKPDGNGKLSKRDGDRLGFPVFPLNWKDPHTGEQSSGYRERGYFPKAFVNMLLLLGWAPSNNQEIFTIDEMVETFTIERIGKSGSKFDPEKTKWFNQQYLRATSNEDLASLIQPMVKERGYDLSIPYLAGVCALMKERAVFIPELLDGPYLFEAPKEYDKDVVAKKWKVGESGALMRDWSAALDSIENFTSENIEARFKEFITEKGLGMGAVMPLFRICLTGILTGPASSEVAALIGVEASKRRIESAISVLG
ncbi:MAG: glutamate--tRNA ligase, partial [Flavobacteriales bacterium]